MDRFRMIFQYFQTNSESVTNGICGLLALASVKIYTTFDFSCPCLAKYNMAYGLGVMFVPPVALFLCGLIVNRQFVAFGWSILLTLIVIAFLARSLKPCFDQAAFFQTRYWSNYIDIEQKIFDETCCDHARDFAHKCILHFFESMQKEIRLRRFNACTEDKEGKEEEEDHLRGITNQDQMNKVLQSWYYSKPPLDLNQTTQRQFVGAERKPYLWQAV
ncbi:hypothetical protein JD844_006902 [Phrynosoma platyrhinos]|uniref:Calcium homeostasis modulator 1 n=1 Tax=Phrynosoma platyrhinos TaxID=52577 RepID=A0ABQ7T2L5_PHRPL|nr:hypothetical protein JD844_006902 [Phrynosoma platyrhinos]